MTYGRESVLGPQGERKPSYELTPPRLISMSLQIVAYVSSKMGLELQTPATLTRISMCPTFAKISSNTESTCSCLLTSHANGSTLNPWPLQSLTVSVRLAMVRSRTTMVAAPALPKCNTVCWPIPRPAPILEQDSVLISSHGIGHPLIVSHRLQGLLCLCGRFRNWPHRYTNRCCCIFLAE